MNIDVLKTLLMAMMYEYYRTQRESNPQAQEMSEDIWLARSTVAAAVNSLETGTKVISKYARLQHEFTEAERAQVMQALVDSFLGVLALLGIFNINATEFAEGALALVYKQFFTQKTEAVDVTNDVTSEFEQDEDDEFVYIRFGNNTQVH